jgi:hypothetical protein
MTTMPTININGTSARELVYQNVVAAKAVAAAITMVQNAAPNGRDYQLKPLTFRFAQEEHLARLDKLEAVQRELESIALFISGAL